MDRLGIIGADWRRGGSESLEELTLPPEVREERVPLLHQRLGVDELIYVATCNRVEILFAHSGHAPLSELRRRAFVELSGRDPLPGEAERRLRVWGGIGALEHLLLVASGLDSAQLGEREIRGQLRDGIRLARRLGLAGQRLDWAMREALRTAREVETATGISDGRTSLAEIGLEPLLDHLRCLGSRDGDPPGGAPPGGDPLRVALVGVSPMTERCGRRLRRDGIDLLVVNRSAERGRALAGRLGATFRSLDDFRQEPDAVDGLITATAAQKAVFDRAVLERLAARCQDARGRAPYVVDFGIPADVDPDVARRLGVERLSMDEISRRAEESKERRRLETAEARQVIDDALERLCRDVAEQMTSPVLGEISQRYHRTAEERVEHLFGRELSHLEDGERDAVLRFAHNLAQRFAHIPLLGLRALAAEYGSDAVETFLAASDGELAETLRAVRPELSDDDPASEDGSEDDEASAPESDVSEEEEVVSEDAASAAA